MQKSRTVKIKIKSEAPNEYIRSDQPLLLTHKTAHDTRMHHTQSIYGWTILLTIFITKIHHIQDVSDLAQFTSTIRSRSDHCQNIVVCYSCISVNLSQNELLQPVKRNLTENTNFRHQILLFLFFILFSFFFVGSIVSLNVDTSTSHIRTQHD